MKRIAVLTSGGDSPGMNAAVRSVTRTAIAMGLEVYGIRRGYAGLLEKDFIPLCRRDVGGIVQQGGTFLGTARCPMFKELKYQEIAVNTLKEFGIDGLVVIGGDGTMRGAEALNKLGVPTVTIPGTIDNDMPGTEQTIGFDTALNTILEAVSKIRDTITSHARVAVIEVMGRHAGHLAMFAGLACGAEVVIVPEQKTSLDDMCKRLHETHSSGKTYSIVLVAEGAYSGYDVYNYLKERTYFDPTVTVLGYIQRGGMPSAQDNIIAALMGECAIKALLNGENEGSLIGYIDGKVQANSYEKAKNMKYDLDENLGNLIRILSS